MILGAKIFFIGISIDFHYNILGFAVLEKYQLKIKAPKF
jgi:hypothetical protein